MSTNPFIRMHNRVIAVTAMAAALLLLAGGPAQAETRTWSGPVSGNWFTVSNWLPNDNFPQAGDTVVVTNGSILLTNETASLAAFSITNATLAFSNWTTRLIATNVTIQNNGILTLPAAFTDAQMSNRVWVICSDFTINAGGRIMADWRGYAAANGQGKGITGGNHGGGGGYGGKGGNGSHVSATAGNPFGSTNAPLAPGSGGAHGYSTGGAAGGAGGGAVWIDATGTVTIDGTVSANGTNGLLSSSYHSGGGSGGAIYISAGTFGGSTNGILQANGGKGGGSLGGAGGGGRIAVTYTSVTSGTGVRFSANRGLGWVNVDVNAPLYVPAAQVGTLSFTDSTLLDTVLATWDGSVSWLNGYVFLQSTNVWMPNRLALSNCTVGIPEGHGMRVTNDLTVTATGGVVVAAQARLTCDGNLLLTNGSSLVAYGGETNAVFTNSYGALVQVTNTLTVASNSWVYPFSHSTNGGAVLFRVGHLVVQSGGGINATNRGYGRLAGFGKGSTALSNGSGGGYGGKGGNGSTSTGGNPYGSTNTPIAPGSGGGDGYSAAGAKGGHGGGTVWVEATGGITIDGAVLANGENGRINTTSYQSGAGAGGAIFMMCDTFSGTGGVLEAKGGNGGGTLGGAGGGGRISIAIGLSSADRAKLIAGQEITGLIANLQDPSFVDGTISVTNGTGWTNAPPGGAAMGSRQFLKVQAANQHFVTIDGTPGQYGSPSPNGYAAWPVEDGTVFTNSVVSPANEANGLRRACVGWSLIDTAQGTPITNEVGNQAVFTVNTNVTLTWSWTNEYQLAFAPGPNGSVNSNILNGWYTDGTAVTTIEAMPAPGYYFVAWVGSDVPGAPAASNPLTVTMDRARTNITATFASQVGAPITWTGTGNWMSFTNWSPPGVPGSNDSVLVQAGSVTLSEPYRIGDLVVNTGATLIFTNWATRLMAGGDVTVLSNGVMTLPTAFTEEQMSNRIWVVCENFTLAAGGKVLADARGYAAVKGTGKGTTSYPSAASGAGHGGKGGDGTGATGGNSYGSSNAPLDPGSGGGHGYSSAGAAGGAGGGAVWIEATDSLTIDGAVTANGGSGAYNHPYVSGGGSGGSIFMTGKTFAGDSSGTLQAKGGAGGGSTGGGAGGGRIAVWIGLSDDQKDWVQADNLERLSVESTNRFFAGTHSVTNGTGWTNQPPGGAESGTLRFITPKPLRGSVFMVR